MSPIDPGSVLRRLRRPVPPVDAVLDTDAYNEIDDQFALVYALLSPERLRLQAICAAPFHNERSSGPADGMQLSYQEVLRVMDVMGKAADGLVHRGSTAWLPGPDTPVPSPACDVIVELARRRDGGDPPLYVIAIGAITNVASALLAAPDIREKVVVLWLGGHPLYWPCTDEFNLRQDPSAARVVLGCGVPLVLFPCRLVAEGLTTTPAELDAHLAPASAIGAYLARIFREYERAPMDRPGASKEVWDLAPLAWLMDDAWVQTTVEPSPVLTDGLTWSRDARRHPIRVAQHIDRDAVFTDLFAKAGTREASP